MKGWAALSGNANNVRVVNTSGNLNNNNANNGNSLAPDYTDKYK